MGALRHVEALFEKSKRRSKALPALGFAGVSLSMASGATASTGGATDVPSTSQPNELFLGEEEIFDTSLSTFYTFDKENVGQTPLAQHLKLARAAVAVDAAVAAVAEAEAAAAEVPTWAAEVPM